MQGEGRRGGGKREIRSSCILCVGEEVRTFYNPAASIQSPKSKAPEHTYREQQWGERELPSGTVIYKGLAMGLMGRKEAASAKNNKKRLGFGLNLKSDTFNSNLDAASNADENITFSTETEETAEYLQTRDGAAEEGEDDFNVNVLDGNRFSCAHNGGFVANRFSCANTVGSDSASSIKTYLKPITSLLECGQAHAADYGIFEPAEKMSSKIPSIAQISQLQISDCAYTKRSNGVWTYSTVLEIGEDSITFSVDEFGNEKNITKHRWLSSIRLVKSAEDEEDAESTVAEEYSMSISSSGPDDYTEDASPVASLSAAEAADRKAQLKAKVEMKKMDLKAKKMDLKAKKKDIKRQAQQAKAAAAEAKRKEREVKRKSAQQAKAAAAEAKRKEKEAK
eukprot:scaffold10209_cov116-Skeletonema_dohrnii-CCMP3373.AAC.5